MNLKSEDSYIVTNPSGHYVESCVRFGFCKPHQYLVVSFNAWNKWYNEARFSRVLVKPPMPAFCGDTYEIAVEVTLELNNYNQLTTTEGK